MAKNIYADCDNCHEKFLIQVHIRPAEKGGEQHYLKCPKCETEYVVANITYKGTQLRKRAEALRIQLRKARTDKAKATILRQFNIVQKQLEREISK